MYLLYADGARLTFLATDLAFFTVDLALLTVSLPDSPRSFISWSNLITSSIDKEIASVVCSCTSDRNTHEIFGA
jgi:hypothetical protein